VPFERKEKDKKEFIEYYSDDVHESVFKKIIQRSYRHFRLFCNTFVSNMEGCEVDEKIASLRLKFENFYTKYLVTINLQNVDIVDAIECIQYKPVTHLIFFRIVNFLNIFTAIKTLRIKKCVFLYGQEVVYSSVSPMDLYIIMENLNDSLFPKFHQRRNNNQNFDSDKSTGYFVNELETDSILNAPKVFLQDSSRCEIKSHRMIVYNIAEVSLVMFIDGEWK
jgi:Intu longin-like domain 2